MTGWLRAFPFAAGLTDRDVEWIERIVVEQRWPEGHVFVREGDRAQSVSASMWFLLEGTVRVHARAPEGGFGIERRLVPGQVFGAVALVADVPRTATCEAAGPVVVGHLDRRTFDELFRRDAGVHARFQLMIARSIAADLRALRAALLAALPPGDPR